MKERKKKILFCLSAMSGFSCLSEKKKKKERRKGKTFILPGLWVTIDTLRTDVTDVVLSVHFHVFFFFFSLSFCFLLFELMSFFNGTYTRRERGRECVFYLDC